jgi:hypothetical protein
MPGVLCVLVARLVETVLRRTVSGEAKSTYCKMIADIDRKTQYADRIIRFHSRSTFRWKACRRENRSHHACPEPGQFRSREIWFRRLSH